MPSLALAESFRQIETVPSGICVKQNQGEIIDETIRASRFDSHGFLPHQPNQDSIAWQIFQASSLKSISL